MIFTCGAEAITLQNYLISRIENPLENITLILGFITLLTIIPFWRKLNRDEKYLCALPILYFITDTICDLASYFQWYGNNNLWIYNRILLPVYIFSLYSYYRIIKTPHFKRIIIIFILLFSADHIYFLITPGHFFELNSIGLGSVLLFMGLVSYFHLFEHATTKDESIFNDLLILFSAISLIYNVGRVPVTTIGFWVSSVSDATLYKLYTINDILYSLWYIVIIVSLFKIKKW